MLPGGPGSMGLKPGQRTKILHATQHGQKNQNKKKKKIRMARVKEEKEREHEPPLSLANEINGSWK